MAINFVVILAAAVWYLLPCALLGILQYFLCKQENPWLGCILPILTGGVSVLVFFVLLLNVAAVEGAARAMLALVVLLLVMNIPTAVFAAIYHFTRRRFAEKRDMDRMNIQDLE